MNSTLKSGYNPSDTESYMNQTQLEFFRKKLLDWREQLLEDSHKTLEHLKESKSSESEAVARGTLESNTGIELKTRDRYRKLIKKIDNSLIKIETGTYGYCEETGEEIGLKRLEARPVATLCIEAQERHERLERQRKNKR